MEKEEKGNELTKKFWITVIAVCSILMVLIIIGFVVFHNREPEVIEKEEDGGYVSLNYTSEVNALSILNATPMSDTDGMKNMKEGQYFDFSVDVDVDEAPKVEYEISIIKDEKASTIKDEDIRIYLEKEDSGTYSKIFGPEEFVASKNFSSVGSELGSMVLINTQKVKSGTDNYRLRLWLSDKASVTSGSYSVEIDIHAIAK